MKKNLKINMAKLLASTLLVTGSVSGGVATDLAKDTGSLAISSIASVFEPVEVQASTDERGTLTYIEVIEPQYEDGKKFSQDLVAVKKDGKWGYVNENNKTVIPFEYANANAFNENLAVVAKENGTKYSIGFIDKNNKFTQIEGLESVSSSSLVAPSSTNVNDSQGDYQFYNGVLVYAGIPYDTSGKRVFTEEQQNYNGKKLIFSVYKNGYMVAEGTNYVGLWDIDGNVLIESFTNSNLSSSYNYKNYEGDYTSADAITDMHGVSQGLIFTQAYNKSLNAVCWGFMDAETFEWVIEPKYYNYWVDSNIREKFDEIGLTTLRSRNSSSGSMGAIDKEGNTIIPFEYDTIYPAYEGLQAFQKNNKWGYMDENHEVVIPATYYNAGGFNNGYAVVQESSSKGYLINTKGEKIEGSELIDTSLYLYTSSNNVITRARPSELVTITSGGKTGYARVEYITELPEEGDTSDWAYDEVVEAILRDLVPASLQNRYDSNIIRKDFANLIMHSLRTMTEMTNEELVKEKTGKELSEFISEYPFTDTSDEDIIAANTLGVLNGYGNGLFKPENEISREEAAKMLANTAEFVFDKDVRSEADSKFDDNSGFYDWATYAIDYVYSKGIMSGSNNNFNAKDVYTREQSYLTVNRLFDEVK